MRNCTLTFPHGDIILDNLRQILTLATAFPFDILQLFYTLKFFYYKLFSVFTDTASFCWNFILIPFLKAYSKPLWV